jgi:WD40 repeat protein
MGIQNLSFNQLGSHLVCCTDRGYIIYALSPSIERKLFTDMKGGVGIMKMLNRTNIGIVVGGSDNPFKSKDIMILWDDLKKASLIEIDLRQPIKNCLINKDKIIVVLEKEICVFNFEGNLIDKKKTYCNKNGLCVMNSDENRPIIVSVGSKKGEIAVWKLNHENYSTIQAHNSEHNIEMLAISRDGGKVATASESGTLINVYSTESYELLYQFRRGTSSTKIHDLSFSWDGNFLACCSGNGTVHIFELYAKMSDSMNIKSSLTDWISEDYLPGYFGSMWSFVQHRLNTYAKMTCTFDDKHILHVATYEGKYYRISGNKYEDIKSDDLQYNIVEDNE